MADLSHLGGLNSVELDLGTEYPVAKQSTFRLPTAGVYTLQAPPDFPQAAFTRTKAGSIQIQIDPTIVDGPHAGFLVRFVKVSGKVFDRNGSKASQIGDYLKACGFSGVIRDEQALANAVEATAGRVYQAKLDWRGYNKRTGWSIEGMQRFPKNADGTYQSWTVDPSEVGQTDENGNQLRVFASLYIPLNGFIPAVE